MATDTYKAYGTSVTTPVEMKRRKEVFVSRPLTDYTLFYHYDDIDQTPVRGVSFRATLSDGDVRTGFLDQNGRAVLSRACRGPVSVQYQHNEPAADDAEIVAAREEVWNALSAIVAQTRTDMADEWREWNEAGWLKQKYLLSVNRIEGTAVGAWEWLAGTVEAFWQLGVLLYKTDKEVREIRLLFLTGQWDALDQKIAAYRSKGETVLAAASEIKELLILLFHDEKTRSIIQAFGIAWWNAIPPDEQEELERSVGTQIGIDVVIAVILAAFTAGAAAATYGSAKWTATIGKLGSKLVALLERLKGAFTKLAHALRKRKRRVVDVRQADAQKVVETKWEADPQPIALRPGTDYALVNGVKVFPSRFSTLYHGTSTSKLGIPNLSNKEAAVHIYKHGLPERGKNIDLAQHADGAEDRAFRGATTMVQTPDRQAGAVFWADEGGLIVELKNVNAYDVNQLLEGRVKSPDGRFGGNKYSGEQELAVPGAIPPENIEVVYEVVRTRAGHLRHVRIER